MLSPSVVIISFTLIDNIRSNNAQIIKVKVNNRHEIYN